MKQPYWFKNVFLAKIFWNFLNAIILREVRSNTRKVRLSIEKLRKLVFRNSMTFSIWGKKVQWDSAHARWDLMSNPMWLFTLWYFVPATHKPESKVNNMKKASVRSQNQGIKDMRHAWKVEIWFSIQMVKSGCCEYPGLMLALVHKMNPPNTSIILIWWYSKRLQIKIYDFYFFQFQWWHCAVQGPWLVNSFALR